MKAILSENHGYICLCMRGQETDKLLPNLTEILENAAEEGENGVEVEIKIEEKNISIEEVFGPASV